MMRHTILGIEIDALTQKEVLDKIQYFVREGGAHQIVTANPEILDNATRQPALRQLIREAALVTADGHGVLLAGKILGTPFPERVTGIELVEALCAESGKRGLSLYFLGAAPGVVDEAKANIERQYPDVHIVGSHHGYFKNEGPDKVLAAIRQAAPDILCVGMGSPFQEEFIKTYQASLGVPVAMGVGGSFDVLSGRVARAPELFQRLKLEWAYRIVTDRKRWKRAWALPRFVCKVIAQRFTK